MLSNLILVPTRAALPLLKDPVVRIQLSEVFTSKICVILVSVLDKACVGESTRLDDVFCIIQKYKLKRKLQDEIRKC